MSTSTICHRCRTRTNARTCLPPLIASPAGSVRGDSAISAGGFFKRLIDKAPFIISKVLTDNGKAFTDRFCATGERHPTGNHAFDRVCSDNRIEHRLIKPRRPQTNGMIKHFNGRIADVLRTHRFDSTASLQAILKRFVYLYNHHIPQKGLLNKTPLQMLKQWRAQKPHLFKKNPCNHPGPDTYQSVAVLGMRNGTSQSPFRPALGRQLVRAADAPLRGHGFGTSRLRQTPTTNGLTAYRMRLHLACVSSGTYGPFATSASRSRLRLPRTTRLALRASLAGSGRNQTLGVI